MIKDVKTPNTTEMQAQITLMGEKARQASRRFAAMSTQAKNDCLLRMADEIENSRAEIIKANKIDLEHGESNGLSSAMLDRLKLNKERIKGMADGLRAVAQLDDPVGKSLDNIVRPNG